MDSQYLLAIDIGGTKILMGLLDEQAHIRHRMQEPIAEIRSAEACLDQLERMSRELLKRSELSAHELIGIGVACPGPLDYERGIVLDTPNLNWAGLRLRGYLDEIFGRSVHLDNDANLAAWGSYCYEAGADCRHMVYLTVSTGIGGALILDGKLYRGSAGGAGEIGHMQLLPGGPRCGCGGSGCLEALASGSALSRRLRRCLHAGRAESIAALAPCGQAPGPPEIAAAARQGDPAALALLAPVKRYLSAGIASLVNIFNPQLIVIGGGIGLNMADLLMPAIRAGVAAQVFPLHQQNLQIITTSLGDGIVLKGIAAAILNRK